MTLTEARVRASAVSREHGCIQHVNATIVLVNFGVEEYQINQKGYTVTDWLDDSTVESYVNGKLQS